MGFLTGKKLLITGVLSNRSIAYGIARACHAQGAELAFSYVGERFKDRITDFAAEFDSQLIFDCDVGSDEQIERMFADLAQVWPKFDGFVHSIGFAPREAIAGNFLEGLSREGFRIAHDISAYSFPAMAKAALPYLNDKSSLLTLSYLGALRSIPNYNTMGLAKASLEASVRYLAEAVGRTADGLDLAQPPVYWWVRFRMSVRWPEARRWGRATAPGSRQRSAGRGAPTGCGFPLAAATAAAADGFPPRQPAR